MILTTRRGSHHGTPRLDLQGPASHHPKLAIARLPHRSQSPTNQAPSLRTQEVGLKRRGLQVGGRSRGSLKHLRRMGMAPRVLRLPTLRTCTTDTSPRPRRIHTKVGLERKAGTSRMCARASHSRHRRRARRGTTSCRPRSRDSSERGGRIRSCDSMFMYVRPCFVGKGSR